MRAECAYTNDTTYGVSRHARIVAECIRSVETRAVAGDEYGGCLRFAVAATLIASIASKRHCKSEKRKNENRENSAKNGETWQLFEN